MENATRSNDKKIVLEGDNVVYEKIKFLGDGSYSTVSLYRKHDRRSGSKSYVALKKLKHNSSGPSNTELAQIVNEIKILSIIDHENITKYYGAFELNQRFYIETEYADAGTLEQFLSTLSNPLEEIEILVLFVQIASAVDYIHNRWIIHRDIKTSNIFLTCEGYIKLGDFGIAKIIDSKHDAKTFVGTPYYIGPEIFKGKNYSTPVDIWAMGCILYEMASLTKTFDAGNMSTLMAKIIKGTYVPVNSKYSHDFQKLIRTMLRRNPAKRCNSEQVVEKTITLINKLTPLELPNVNSMTLREICPTNSMFHYIKSKNAISMTKSSLFCFDVCSQNLTLKPVLFDSRVQLVQFCKGRTHYLSLTKDNQVFSWGAGPNGQLGLGRDLIEVEHPTVMRSLRNYSILKIASGNDFSVILLKNGMVMATGRASSNCLGSKTATDVFEPEMMNSLLSVNVVDIDCGPDHVVVITAEGVALSWGNNHCGQLGIGVNLELVLKPLPMVVPKEVKFRKVICGDNCTALIDLDGFVWATGNNDHNKLALNSNSIFQKREFTHVTQPRKVKLPIQNVKISNVQLGLFHSVFMTENSKAIFSGSNFDAQLGIENVYPVYRPVQTLKTHKFQSIVLGAKFTLALSDNSVLFWGTRQTDFHRHHFDEEEDCSTVFNEEFIVGNSHQSLMELVQTYGPDRPILKKSQPRIVVETVKELCMVNTANTVVLKPQRILNLYSSKTFQDAEVKISRIFCFNDDSVFVIIDSTTSDFPANSHAKFPGDTGDYLLDSIEDGLNSETKYSYGWAVDD